jgi:ABC-type transporter Mla subunit MlaD
MGRFGDTVKIGAVIVASMFGLWGAMQLIGGITSKKGNTYYYFVTFENARGVSKGMNVEAAGSPVGYVDGQPDYDPQSQTTLAKVRIEKDVPVFVESRLVVESSGLVGEHRLSLDNPPKGTPAVPAQEGTTLVGVSAADMTAMVKRADEIMETVSDLLGPEKLGGALTHLTGRFDTSLARMDIIAQRVDKMLVENNAYIGASMKNVQLASANFVTLSHDLQSTSQAMRALATDPANKSQMDAVLANLNRASASLAVASAQAETLSNDVEMQNNMRETIRLAKETLEETKKSVQALGGTLGGVDKLVGGMTEIVGGVGKKLGTGKGKDQGKGEGQGKAGEGEAGDECEEPEAESKKGLEGTASVAIRGVDHNSNGKADDGDRIVGDVRAAVGMDGKYVAAGVDNIGSGGRINMLLGFGSAVRGPSARAGVYRGDLGAGLAWYGGGAGLEVTAYDPLDIKYDAYGFFPAGESIDVILGAEDVTDDPRVTVGVGKRW